MTAYASDILSIFFLQKEAKIKSLLRVVPLFETLEDLKNAKTVMKKLFSLKKIEKNREGWIILDSVPILPESVSGLPS